MRYRREWEPMEDPMAVVIVILGALVGAALAGWYLYGKFR